MAQSILVSPLNLDSLQEILQERLADDCIEIINASYSGNPLSIGLFTKPANASFLMEEGILLSTGNVMYAVGPNNSSSYGQNMGTPGDSLLEQLIQKVTFDAASISFDLIIHSGDSLSLQYLFASDEYPEFSNTLTDLMGIFVTGPTPPLVFPYNNWNIATVPGTSQAVSVYTINQDNHPENYHPNSFNSNEAVQFDGYTSVLKANMEIVPCNTYHVKIVVTDVMDKSYDTGVFLKLNSLSVGANDSHEIYNLSYAVDSVLEGCPVQIHAEKAHPGLLNDSILIKPSFNSFYSNYIDYDSLTDFLFIPAGSMTEDFILQTLPMANYAPVNILLNQKSCDCYVNHEILTYLGTPVLTFPIFPPDSLICSPDHIYFDLVPPFNYPDSLDYSWSTGSTSNDGNIYANSAIDTLSVYVTDGCLQEMSDEILVYVFNMIQDILPDSIPLVDGSAELEAMYIPTALYEWSNGGTSANMEVNEEGIYTVEVFTNCGVLYDTVKVYEFTGISSPEENSAFALFPNPADEYTYLTSSLADGNSMELSIYSMDGNLLKGWVEASSQRIRLDIGNYPAGVYLIRIAQSGFVTYQKLIIN